MNKYKDENTFSIELKSKNNISIELPKKLDDSVLVEGSLGHLISLRFVEGAILEIEGSIGILRIDLDEKDWTRALDARSNNEQKKDLEANE